MKKILVIAAAAFAALSAQAQNVLIGRVNTTELIQLAPEADAARATLNAQQKEAEDTYKAMAEEYQTKLTAYQQKQASWTPGIKETKEKELSDLGRRLQEFEQTIQQELSAQQQNLFSPIQQKALETVSKIAKEKGCVVVFDNQQAIYFDESKVVDLTADARKAMNIPESRTLEQLQKELQAQAQAQ